MTIYAQKWHPVNKNFKNHLKIFYLKVRLKYGLFLCQKIKMKGLKNMLKMEEFIAVNGSSDSVLGKILYFSLSSILVEKEKLHEIGYRLGLPKVQSQRESLLDTFKAATGDIRDRVVKRNGVVKKILKIYVRDNERSRSNKEVVSRELVKEVLGTDTNHYVKLANLYFNLETRSFWYEYSDMDPDVDSEKYCRRAEELFELYQKCYGRNAIETLVDSFIAGMDAVKISVHGKMFFVPRHKMSMVDVLEDFIEELDSCNLNSGTQITANSMFVINDEKQRLKMEQEFYTTVRKELEICQERLQHFIQTGSQSSLVIGKWLNKISKIEEKKQKYEDLFRKELDRLNDDFDVLKLQSQELQLRLKKLGSEGDPLWN